MAGSAPTGSFTARDEKGRLRASRLNPTPGFIFRRRRTAACDDYDILCEANRRLFLGTVGKGTATRHLAGWVYRFAPQLVRSVRKHGNATLRVTGRSIPGQMADMAMLANRAGFSPSEYYQFGLARFGGGDELKSYVPHRFFRFVALACGQRRERNFDNPPDFSDKSVFESHCRKFGFPCVRTVATVSNGGAFDGDGVSRLERLPDNDLFVKPKRGGQGRNTLLFRSLGQKLFQGTDGKTMTADALLADLPARARAAGGVLLVQEALANNAFVEVLAGKALATTRIITIRNEADEPEVVFACFRTSGSAESIVDNYHAGGIAFGLDISSGVLGTGRRLSFAQDPRYHENHPVTGSRMLGLKLPQWAEAGELALGLHRSSPHLLVCGWDIAFTGDGPCAVEANIPPGLLVVQMHRGFLGTRYSQLLAMHAKAGLEEDEAASRT